ncbi:peritrophin-44-like [Drosophila kikkawai]|uniref:Peritrophin-44-like n=1 Tax=Drosophila kikkawai TaxID=30033 RepID=A0ABM4GA27_DROKI
MPSLCTIEALNSRIWILGVLLLTTTQGSRVDDICYNWLGNLGDGFTVGQTNATICFTNWNENDAGDHLVSDLSTCYGYYYCESKTSVGVWNHCPTNQHFNLVTGECVSPETYVCVYNRCRNVKKPYLAVVNSACFNYQSCATGAIFTCPAQKPYFDEVIQSCVATQPASNICLWVMR